MKHYGDITKINGAEAPVVDIITGGSPCQDLSVAGKRAGLAGERSGLFMEQMRIVKEMRERERATGRTGWMVRPRYMVWENVPGAFSSGNPKGADFAAVIEEIIKVAEPGAAVSVCVPNGGWTKSGCYYAEDGSWSIAWRVHDAQFWGVPQRRKRISLVADFGGLSAPEILFERKGLSGDSEPCGAQREATAGAVGEGVEDASGAMNPWDSQSAKGILIQHEHDGSLSTLNNQSVLQVGCDVYNQEITGDVAASLTAASGGTNTSGPKALCLNDQGGSVMAFAQNQVGEARVSPMSGTLNTNSNATGRNSPLVYDARGNGIGRSDNAGCGGEDGNQKPCVFYARYIDTTHADDVVRMDNTATPLQARDYKGGKLVYDARENGDGKTVCTITGDHQNRVTDYTALCVGNGQANQSVSDKAGALNTMHDQQAVMVQAVVRRLTPLECERLQGYPDGWTDIGEWTDSKGKKHGEADSPRYKALGNSIALPFWQWMARRICAQYERPATMASLFDGIGGFPLVFQRCGAIPVWASEIEEFPIAVTKVRFPNESVR